ncbi:MAG: putative phage abortive infection protein [Chitinophagales bacterium]|nr:putative phage abortive infection protein [Chitinophagales bacterium]
MIRDDKLEQEIEDEFSKVHNEEIRIQKEIVQKEKQINTFRCFAWAIIAIGGLVLILGLLHYLGNSSNSNLKLNELGDFLSGAVASLWALAGLFLIYVAFLGQQKQMLYQSLEIKYGQLELKSTRLEIKGQKEQLKEQNKTMKLQQFENTFFQLLSLHNEIVKNMDIKGRSGNEVTGRDCFEEIYQMFFNECSKQRSERRRLNKNASLELSKEEVSKIFQKNYSKRKSDLGHYFRFLYHLLKFVHKSKIEMKKRYTNFIRAQLSSYELLIIFHYGLIDRNKELRNLLESYQIFRFLNQAEIINKNSLSGYKEQAYE